MVFITAGMGGGTGTGAAPVVARAAREQGILTVGVVTKPFSFEGNRRARLAEDGIDELHRHVDTLIVIPNQNLFRVANEKTTFADAFAMADQVLFSGVACITDLMVKEGLINLDFADVRAVMRGMGKAMMGTGEASGEDRARHAAEAAIANPLLDDVSMHGARGLLISITGGPDLTLYEVDEAASRIREEVDSDANIILGATFDPNLQGTIRVSVVATGTDATMVQALEPARPNAARAPLAVKRHVPVEPSRPVTQVAQQPTALDSAFERQVEDAVAEAIGHGLEPAEPHHEDDGNPRRTLHPRRCRAGSLRRGPAARRAADSQRLRAGGRRPSGRSAPHAAHRGAAHCCAPATTGRGSTGCRAAKCSRPVQAPGLQCRPEPASAGRGGAAAARASGHRRPGCAQRHRGRKAPDFRAPAAPRRCPRQPRSARSRPGASDAEREP
jgi:cell division GTPase FtsZ